MYFIEEDEIARIIAKSVLDDISPEEHTLLEEWSGASSGYRAVYEEATSGNIVGNFDRDATGIDKTRELAAIGDKIRRRKRRRTISWSISAAAIFAAVMFVGLFIGGRMEAIPPGITPGSAVAILEMGDGRQVRLDTLQNTLIEQNGVEASLCDQNRIVYMPSNGDQGGDVVNTLHVPRGGEYKVTLGDGTHIWLNAGSSLEYPLRFGSAHRRVKLQGEGYFEVAHDTERPFIVETQEQVLTVLGTKFNISAYPEDGVTVTTLCEGSVQVEEPVGGRQAMLAVGQQAQLVSGAAEFALSTVNAQEFTRWKDGIFLLDEQSLGQVMHNIARWYDIQAAPVDTAGQHIVFKGNLPKYEELDKLLGMIEKISPVRFYMRDGILHVRIEE